MGYLNSFSVIAFAVAQLLASPVPGIPGLNNEALSVTNTSSSYGAPRVPLSHSGAGSRSTWTPEPKGRGTFGIIFSCMITLSLCVWTAIHINVIPSTQKSKRLRIRLRWTIISLLSPEIVLWRAYDQWSTANTLHRKWCKHFGIRPGSEEDRLKIEGAFFVVMGGFTLGPSEDFGSYPSTLTPKGFIEWTEKSSLVKHDILNQKLILDKGKADTIAKLFVCAQALWMVVQSIFRAVYNLPCTLLEVHVVMHVVYTVVMYFFWLKKPLDVSESIPVLNSRALGSILSFIHGDLSGIKFDVFPKVEGSPNALTGSATFHVMKSSEAQATPTAEFGESVETVHFVTRDDSMVARRTYQDLHNCENMMAALRRFFKSPLIEWLEKEEFLNTIAQDPGSIAVFQGESLVAQNEFSIRYEGPGLILGTLDLNKTDIENFRHAAAAIQNGEYHEFTTLNKENGVRTVNSKRFKGLLAQRAANGKINGRLEKHLANDKPRLILDGDLESFRLILKDGPLDLFRRGHLNQSLIISFLCLLYGGCHVAAWNNHFPTDVERVLWLVSCMTVSALPLVFFSILHLVNFIYHPSEPVVPTTRPSLPLTRGRWGLFIAGRCLIFFAFELYGAVRVFLLVEAFISMRSVPEGAYETVRFSDYWPHLK